MAPNTPYTPDLDGRPPVEAIRDTIATVARLVAGDVAVVMGTVARGASNAKAKRELGWQPRYASWRQGFAQGLG